LYGVPTMFIAELAVKKFRYFRFFKFKDRGHGRIRLSSGNYEKSRKPDEH